MFERFTHDARRVVVAGQEAARRTGAEQVEPEHLLLAVTEGGGAAATALREAGVDGDGVAAAIEADLAAMLAVVGVAPSVVDALPARPRGDVPRFGVQARSALEQALREAVRRGDRRIGSEHLLLGMLRPPSPTLARVLARHDVEAARLAALVELELAAARR